MAFSKMMSDRGVRVSICTYVLVTQNKLGIYLARSSSGVSICTFVLLKQVKWVPGCALLTSLFSRCQYLYFCTSKASKVSTWLRLVDELAQHQAIRHYGKQLLRLHRKHPRQLPVFRQHTSAYGSIRQHTSAYVSIRLHTSARQHTPVCTLACIGSTPASSLYSGDIKKLLRLC